MAFLFLLFKACIFFLAIFATMTTVFDEAFFILHSVRKRINLDEGFSMSNTKIFFTSLMWAIFYLLCCL